MSIVLSQLRWPSMAQDLAIMGAPGEATIDIDGFCRSYGLTEAELNALLTVPEFQELLRHAVEQVHAQGDKAGPRYRAAVLSRHLSEALFRKASLGEMNDKEAIKFLEILLRSAGLYDPPPVSTTQVNVGVAAVPIPVPSGMNNPKLSHLVTTDATSQPVALSE